MRVFVFVLIGVGFTLISRAQTVEESASLLQQEWQAEDRPELMEEEDIQQQVWQERRKHPLDINQADSLDWMELGLFQASQVKQILHYRAIFGRFLDIHELQAIPGIPVNTWRFLRPMLVVASVDQQIQPANVQHQLLVRLAGGTRATEYQRMYGGVAVQALVRYRVKSSHWQAGFLAEQDAGERWRRMGADFQSFFLSRQRPGSPVRWIIGDFQFSFGQGLLIGQQVGGNRSIYPEQLIRAPQGLMPYRGIGEFAFFRGAALRWRQKRSEWEGFVSYRRLDGTMQEDTLGFTTVSTLYTSGIRRTASERARRNNLGLWTTGLSYHRSSRGLTWGSLLLRHQLSESMQPANHPRNRYAFAGDHWLGISAYLRGEWRNVLYTAESVWSSRDRVAVQAMASWSLDRRLDLSVVFRHASPGYTAWFGQALSASSRFTNETGLLTALVFRWSKRWESGFFVDRWQHPWMRYLAHYPALGSQWQAQLAFKPKRNVQWLMVYRVTERLESESGDLPTLPQPFLIQQRQIRMALQVDEWAAWKWRIRGVWNRRKQAGSGIQDNGLAWSAELKWQPPRQRWRLHLQWVTSRVPSYQARVYLQQADLPGLNQLTMWDSDGRSAAMMLQYRISPSLQVFGLARYGTEFAQIAEQERFIRVVGQSTWFWRFQLQYSPSSRQE